MSILTKPSRNGKSKTRHGPQCGIYPSTSCDACLSAAPGEPGTLLQQFALATAPRQRVAPLADHDMERLLLTLRMRPRWRVALQQLLEGGE